jgi:REP element-mobilizing transposase RayT
VFRRQADHELFLDRLGEACATHQVRVISYCLMPNHFHLFVRTELPNLSRFMHGLLTSFTMAQNRQDDAVTSLLHVHRTGTRSCPAAGRLGEAVMAWYVRKRMAHGKRHGWPDTAQDGSA